VVWTEPLKALEGEWRKVPAMVAASALEEEWRKVPATAAVSAWGGPSLWAKVGRLRSR